ncbi:hypothetical protein [Ideonella sp. A 288]|uniref:hypothetical protein n=1 Tax=Ideonella sp. A 288 TaxID=1962181 RepID=UPI000B4B7DAB|nr:hypothetical protein [Ideonella sp. A 288]
MNYDHQKFTRLSLQVDGLRGERDSALQMIRDEQQGITAEHLRMRRHFQKLDTATADAPPSQWLDAGADVLAAIGVKRGEIEALIRAQSRVEAVRKRLAELDSELTARVAVLSACRDYVAIQDGQLKVYAP